MTRLFARLTLDTRGKISWAHTQTRRAHLFTKIKTTERALTRQSGSPLAPIGVDAALEAAKDPSLKPKPKIFNEFALADRVGIVSGGNRGIGLEMALALCEAGARAIYCLGLSGKPSDDWIKTRDFVERFGNGSRMEYVSVDVRNQKEVWEISEGIGEKEKRMDLCVAAAGVLKSPGDCLTYQAAEFEEIMDVNTNGVLYTAQGAGQQMRKFGNGGSMILIASKSGSLANEYPACVPYNTSKSAVLQMARSMACELGPEGIRVNSLSPGYMYTAFAPFLRSMNIGDTEYFRMTAEYLDEKPEVLKKWSKLNPMGRIGRPDELRGAVTWLASDASSYCTGSEYVVDLQNLPKFDMFQVSWLLVGTMHGDGVDIIIEADENRKSESFFSCNSHIQAPSFSDSCCENDVSAPVSGVRAGTAKNRLRHDNANPERSPAKLMTNGTSLSILA